HVMGSGADCVLAFRIENHEVRIAADSDCAFPRIQPKQLSRSSRDQFHETVYAETTAGNTARVDQAHAMLDAGPPVGYFREVVTTHFFLLFEAKRAMIRRNNLEVIV